MRAGVRRHAGALLLAAHSIAGCATIEERPPSPVIAEAGMRKDLALWFDAMRATNPDYAARADIDGVSRMVREIDAKITGSKTRVEAWRLMALLNPLLNDGHSGIVMPDQFAFAQAFADQGGSLFPIPVAIDDSGRLFAADGAGGEITAVNNVPAQAITEAILARTHGDTPRFRRALAARRFQLYYLLLFGSPRSYAIDMRGRDGARSRATYAGTNRLDERLAPDAAPHTHFEHAILRNGVGYLKAGSFDPVYADYFREFTNRAFDDFRKAEITSLIIDIRSNGGGDDPLWQENLMENITTKPYRHVSRYKIRVTRENADPGDVIGEVQSNDYKRLFTPAADNPRRFGGKTYILVDALTYSAAIQFAVAAQDYAIADIAGEETGGLSCQTGRATTIELKETGLRAFAPLLAFTRPSGEGCARGVIPDIPVSMDGAPDDVLAALVEFIAGNRKKRPY